ncbi:HBS1 (RNA metabolism translation) [Cryptosporidium bovis]|uniref:HBS1 (RNA metabolism translation) n=1 Tax=Cryptosporidium bovis TaxID=310047 RepID=UPI00351A1A65|nr:HBS1 (RNA metabolism translation) [Cryptosporidium bovis]
MGRQRSKHLDLTDDDYYDGYDSEDDYDYCSEDEPGSNNKNNLVEFSSKKLSTNKKNNTNLETKEINNIDKNGLVINSKIKSNNLLNKESNNKLKGDINVDMISNFRNYIFVILGHVDSGKSTLMGHLFVNLGYVEKSVIRKYFRESENIGKSSFAYAWVFDDTEDERERGITINVTAKYIKLDKNNSILTILDSPGHAEFIPTSFFATLTSNNAIIVIDVNNYESGFIKGQTKEHISFALFSNVSNIIFTLNKMDTIKWDQNTYNNIVDNIKKYINDDLKELNKSDTNLFFIPVCAFGGVNICNKDECNTTANNNWYNGPTLFELLNNLSSIKFNNGKTEIKDGKCECSPISSNYNNNNKLIAYLFEIISINSNELKASIYLEYGILKVGNQYTLLPSQANIKCKSIFIDNESYNSYCGPVFITSVTFTCNIYPSVGNIVISNNNTNHHHPRNNNNNNNSIDLFYPLFITRKVKVKLIKKLNSEYFINNNIIWNVPGKSFMIYFHCNSIPATLTLYKNNIYFFESDVDFVSYLRCSCHHTSNMGKVIVRFFGITAFIGETIL